MLDQAFEAQVDAMLSELPFALAPEDKEANLFAMLRARVLWASEQSEGYARFIHHWPISVQDARTTEDLPFLPVSAFKREPPLSLVPSGTQLRVVSSSATTGQMPSRVAIDSLTGRRLSKGAARIFRDFLGPSRRPLLVFDAKDTVGARQAMSARSAAIRAFSPFASKTVSALTGEELTLDEATVASFCEELGDEPCLVYGFSWILYQRLLSLSREGRSLGLTHANVLHSGGFKKLEALKVDKQTYNEVVGGAIGCGSGSVIDFYGMVEQVGVVYPDCCEGLKHAPRFADVLIRDPRTLQLVDEGETGLIQVCSVLPTSFPGHLLLTEDLGELVLRDGCACGRRGVGFRFAGRAAKAELRGCSDVGSKRLGAR